MLNSAATNAVWLRTSSFVVLSCFLGIGCDRVRTTSQVVTFKVLDRSTSKPVIDANIETKIAWTPPYPKDEDNKWSKQWWEDLKWNLGSTDNGGEARIEFVEIVLDGTPGSVPPKSRDVTNRRQIVRVIRQHRDVESIEIPLQVGVSDSTVSYVIEIVDTGKPQYMD